MWDEYSKPTCPRSESISRRPENQLLVALKKAMPSPALEGSLAVLSTERFSIPTPVMAAVAHHAWGDLLGSQLGMSRPRAMVTGTLVPEHAAPGADEPLHAATVAIWN